VARDVRRADGAIAALPRSRRLAALLAALAVVGGGSAYAASENVRSVVDKVVRVVVPDTFRPEKADAADFSLRPIGEVPRITPIAALTPDLEFPELRDAVDRAEATQAIDGPGAPTIAVSGGTGYSTSGPVAQAGEPVVHQEVQLSPEHGTPVVLVPVPTATDEVALEPSAPVDSVVQAEAVPAPALVPVTEIKHDPTAPESTPQDNPPGVPPAVGNPHGTPPGQIKHEGDDDAEAPVPEDVEEPAEPESKPEHPHADGDLPPGLAQVIEKNPDHPHAPAPAANVVTPAPSIAAPTESIFIPAESVSVSAPPEAPPTPAEPVFDPPGTPSLPPMPPAPAVRPPEYAPDSLLPETPPTD
jgi:hypothetical protein